VSVLRGERDAVGEEEDRMKREYEWMARFTLGNTVKTAM